VKSAARRDDGQAALEFMLIIPSFVVFLFLIVDFGMLMYEYVSVANAAREGARYGATNCRFSAGSCSVGVVQDQTIDRSGGILASSNRGEVSVGWVDRTGDGRNDRRGDSIVVSINHPYRFLFLPAGPSIPVVACADMALERDDRGAPLPTGAGCFGS